MLHRMARIVALSAAILACLLLALTVVGVAVLGWDGTTLARLGLASIPFLTVGFSPAGLILAWQRPRNPIGWLLLGTGLSAAVLAVSIPGTVIAADRGWPPWEQVALANLSYSTWTLWFVFVPLALLFFPTGRLGGLAVRALASTVTLVGLSGTVLSLGDPAINGWVEDFGIPADGPLLGGGSIAWLAATPVAELSVSATWVFTLPYIGILGVIAVLVARFVRGGELVRRQLFWILLAGLAMSLLIGTGVISALFGPPFAVLALLLPPLAILVAIVRVNVFDVKLVFSRALAWAILSIALGAAFFGLVALLGTLLVQAASAVLAALIVALTFEPLRRWVQRLIDRLVYGRRGEPVYLVGLLGSGITDAGDLQEIVERLAASLKVPWLAVRTGSSIIASAGLRPADPELVMLRHGEVKLGTLEIGLRRGQRSLDRSDRDTLTLLAPMLSTLVRLTALSHELVASRGQLVGATEEERRRVQRDLHDGVASALGGIAFKVEGIRNRVTREPDAAVALLAEVHADLVRANSSLREVINDLRPPELDTLGLVGALEQATAGLRPPSRTAEVNVRAAPEALLLPAAVEVATYRIGVEAAVNAFRHSDATRVDIRLLLEGPLLSIVVTDNSATGSAPWADGIGLSSMRRRAELLGGRFAAGPTPQGGAVEVSIPIAESDNA